jgi:small subunit ribosomal protein S20
MPIIKSAKKRVKQTAVRQARNYNTRTAMKKAIREVEEAVKAGKKADAEKLLTAAYKIIDTADKKNVLQSNTAARRKSKLARMVSGGTAPKKEVAKKEVVKKEEPKKEVKEEKVEKKEEPKAE